MTNKTQHLSGKQQMFGVCREGRYGFLEICEVYLAIKCYYEDYIIRIVYKSTHELS